MKTSLKTWDRTNRWNKTLLIFFSVLFLVMTIAMFIGAAWLDEQPNDIKGLYFFTMMITLVCGYACFMFRNLAKEYQDGFRGHMAIEDLRPLITLTPSQLENLCLQRLHVLADEVMRAQDEHPREPFASARQETQSKFSRAYWFFVERKCMKSTSWKRFFPNTKS